MVVEDYQLEEHKRTNLEALDKNPETNDSVLYMDKSKLLSYFLADCGLFLFPIHSISSSGSCTCKKGASCTSPGKHPYLNLAWQKIATNSLVKLESWSKKREINYAVCTGRKSDKTGKYLIVVDVDAPEHEITESLPKTFSYKTGSGGFHYWYWSDVPIKNSVSQLANKVDIRGTGGYVIVPPSKHYSGNQYELLCDENEAIADLPLEILRTLSKNSADKQLNFRKNKKTSAIKSAVTVPTALFEWWTRTSIPVIRASLSSGTQIPDGVRNITIHRLLSSDRAKGASTYEELMVKGNQYKQMLAAHETFEEAELRNVVCSVMRYPVYNNHHENVNKNYLKWVSKFKNTSAVPSLEKLESLDLEFFSKLKKSEKNGMSLKSLAQVREEWYHNQGMTEGYATYRSQLLAKKLQELGYEKVRTAKQNLWMIDTSNLFNTEGKENTMTTENATTENSEGTEEGTDVIPATGPIGPDGDPLTLVEEREEVVKAKRKFHPSADKYVGRDSSQEQMSALIKFYNTLNPEQEKAYENGVLIYDEERTRDWMSAIKTSDIVGLKGNMYQIREIEDDKIVCGVREYDVYARKSNFDGEPVELSIYDIDMALNLGVGEILYRNDIPYGLDEEMEYKVKVKVYADKVGRTYVFKTGREIVKEPTKDVNKE